MSQLYRSASIDGTQYDRAYQIVIDHPLHRAPRATFFEERVITTPTGSLSRAVGECHLAYDPTALVPLLDPTTGDPTGQSVSMGELYAMLYSVYIHTATARDQAGGAQ